MKKAKARENVKGNAKAAAAAAAVVREEPRPPLLGKTGGLDLLGQAERRERLVDRRQQRFTDMKPREGLALE